MAGPLRRLAEELTGAAENIVLMDAVDSTHTFAIRLMEQMDEERVQLPLTVVIARRQSEGVGRGGRGWMSPEGGLYLNWIATNLAVSLIAALPMLAAAAAHSTLAALGISEIAIKWPNDILSGDRKLAGILVHAHRGQPTWATIGLGVNLGTAPRVAGHPARQAISVSDLLGPASWEARAVVIATGFVASLARSLEDPEPAIASWRANLAHGRGDKLVVRTADGAALGGAFLGITEEGFLRLRTDGGEQIVSAGEIIEGD